MEERLRNMDFSRFSRVQSSLKQQLLQQYDNRCRLLSDDELDMVVAAAGTMSKPPDQQQRNGIH